MGNQTHARPVGCHLSVMPLSGCGRLVGLPEALGVIGLGGTVIWCRVGDGSLPGGWVGRIRASTAGAPGRTEASLVAGQGGGWNRGAAVMVGWVVEVLGWTTKSS